MESPSLVQRAKLGTYISPILESRRRPRGSARTSRTFDGDGGETLNNNQRCSLYEPPSFQVGQVGDWRRMNMAESNMRRFAQSTNALEHFNMNCDNDADANDDVVMATGGGDSDLFRDNFILRKSNLELCSATTTTPTTMNSSLRPVRSSRNDDDQAILVSTTTPTTTTTGNTSHSKNKQRISTATTHDEGVCEDGDDVDTPRSRRRQCDGDETDDCDYDDDEDDDEEDDEFGHHSHDHSVGRSLLDETDSTVSSMLLGASAGAASPWRLRRGGGLFSSKYATQTAVNASKSASLTYRHATGNVGSLSHTSTSSYGIVPGVYSSIDEDEHRALGALTKLSSNPSGIKSSGGGGVKSPVNRKRMTLSGAKSHSNLVYSSSSGCSTQSSSASSQASLSQPFSRHKTRSSLREATQNFRDFVNDYEQGLIDAICSVEQQQRPTPTMDDDDGGGGGGGVDQQSNKQRHQPRRASLGGPAINNVTGKSKTSGGKRKSNGCGDRTVMSNNEQHQQHPLEQDSRSRQCTPDYNNDNDDDTRPLELSQLNSSLRLQLENVRSLRDKYETGCRTSEALERLMKLTKQKRNCDREFRENERLLTEIEKQLEAMIGTFRIRVEDLEGFARICPRDNYEIEFRHGKQRRIIRVRIGKLLERFWHNDVQEIEFQGALKPIIVCRLREVKSRWRKNVTLGETSISMSELLAAVAGGRQILLDANASGTLKLRIQCFWLPKELKLGATITPTPTSVSTPSSQSIDQSRDRRSSTLNESYISNQNSFSKIPRAYSKSSGFSSDHSKSMLTLPTHHDTGKSRQSDDSLQRPSNKRSKSTVSLNSEHSDDDSLGFSDDSDAHSHTEETVSPRERVELRISRIVAQLKNLEDSLEDYRGQFAEFTMMSIAVQRLLEFFGEDNIDPMFDSSNGDDQDGDEDEQNILDDVETALAEFDFLEDQDSAPSIKGKPAPNQSNTDRSRVIGDYLRRSKATEEMIDGCLMEFDGWNVVMGMHLENAIEQLTKIGAWMLKSREREALARIRVNTFALESIFQQLRHPTKSNPMGKDVRVLELFSFAQRTLGVRWILSWSQLCQTLAEMIKEKLDLDEEWDDDSACYASEWLCGKIVTYEQSKISLFDVRAFFELELWKVTPSSGGPRRNSATPSESLSLRKLFEIALDLDSLTRRSRKLSTQTLERVLFDKFNFENIWVPADVSLAVVEILYESHGQEKQSKPSTSEVKKWNRLREIRKICTNWLLWHVQKGRVEIKEHILSGLESSSPLTRRFSCYGVMYLLKLIKKTVASPEENTDVRRQSTGMTFVGKELDCLLYIAMEDVDGRVREEARRALKCLGHLGEERLKQIERSRMGFLDNGQMAQSTKRTDKREVKSNRCRVGGSMPDDLHRL